ncbi:hypothetical protein ACWEQ0_23755 [Nocardia thailandica]
MVIRIDAEDVAGLSGVQTAAMVRQRLGRAAEVDTRPRLPLPAPIAELLPAGVVRGSTIAHHGSMTLVLGIVAAVSAAGGHVALVEPTDRPTIALGLLAVAELGGDLGKVAVIGPVREDHVPVVHTLLDGVDLVVAGPGRAGGLAPRSARILQARARKCESTLLLTEGQRVEAADLATAARCVGFEGLGRGRGVIRTQLHQVMLAPRGGRTVGGVIRSAPGAGGRIEWSLEDAADLTAPMPRPRLLRETGT